MVKLVGLRTLWSLSIHSLMLCLPYILFDHISLFLKCIMLVEHLYLCMLYDHSPKNCREILLLFINFYKFMTLAIGIFLQLNLIEINGLKKCVTYIKLHYIWLEIIVYSTYSSHKIHFIFFFKPYISKFIQE